VSRSLYRPNQRTKRTLSHNAKRTRQKLKA